MPARGWGFPNAAQDPIVALRDRVRGIRVKELDKAERRIRRLSEPLLAEIAEISTLRLLTKKRKLNLSEARAELARQGASRNLIG